MTPDPSTDPSRTAAQSKPPGDYSPLTLAAPARPGYPDGWPDVPGFVVTSEIARGGMGCVYAAREFALDREVAIKTLLPGANPDRFVTESKITGKLAHPNIPPVYTFGRLANDSPFLVMKRVSGDTLAQLLNARVAPQTALPRFVHIFEQIAQAVGFAHSRGIIHRDLKPANVMVGEFGEVQVMDWGLAKLLSAAESTADYSPSPEEGVGPDARTRAGTIMGTPAYMAPEQANGKPVDARADVFSLGAILAVILTGKPAFVGDTVEDTKAKAARADLTDAFDRLSNCGADRELIDLARKCLSASAEDRPANALAVAGAVANYRAGVESRLRAAETAQAVSAADAASARKRRRIVTVAAVALTAVLTAGVAVSWIQAARARAAEAQERTQRETAETATAKALAEERKAAEREADERKARHHAERQQQIADKTRTFLIDYFAGRSTWTGNISVGGPSGPNVTLREVLDFAEKQVAREFADFPEAEFELRTAFAMTQITRNNADGYERNAKRARELARQLGLENSPAMRSLEAYAAMFGTFRGGPMMPSGLAALVGGATPAAGSGGTAESVAATSHIIKGGFAVHARDFATAEKELRAAVAVNEKAYGPDAPSSLITRLLLGDILRAADKPDKAQVEFDAVVAAGQKVEWGILPVALARAHSRALRVGEADDAAALKMADELEQSKADFDHLELWETEHGALLTSAMARLRQAQKRPAEAAELLARTYRAAEKNPLLPICEIAYRTGLAYAEVHDARAVDFYLTVAMNHPSWANLPADKRNDARVARGNYRLALGRYAEAEADLRPDIPAKMRGNPAEKFSVATLGAAIGNREYLQPYLDVAVPAAGRDVQQAAGALQNLRQLSAIAQNERNYEPAIELHTLCVELISKRFGPEQATDSVHQRGQCLTALGRFADAARDFRPVVASSRRTFGDGGSPTRDVCDELARALGASGNRAEEIALRKQTFEATRKALGDRPDAAWEDAARLLTTCRAANDYSAIDPKAKTAVEALTALAGSDANGLFFQQRIAAKMRPWTDAVAVLAELTSVRITTLGESHPATMGATGDLINAARIAGLPQPTIAPLELGATRAEKDGLKHPNAGLWLTELATALEACDRWADAEPWRRKWLAAAETRFGANSFEVAAEQTSLGSNLLRQKRWADAEVVLRKSLTTRETLAPNLWATFNTRSVLGGALLGLKDYAAAKPLLESGYEGLKTRQATIPPAGRDRPAEAADRLIEWATATGDAEGVKQWKAERARYKELAPMPREKGK